MFSNFRDFFGMHLFSNLSDVFNFWAPAGASKSGKNRRKLIKKRSLFPIAYFIDFLKFSKEGREWS